MKTSMTLLPALVIVLASATGLLAAGAAEARERNTTVTGANGKTLQRQVTRSQGDVSSTTTLPGGKTTSRVVERSSAGTTATLTGRNGRTATRVTTRQP